jgi:hypothetical protein
VDEIFFNKRRDLHQAYNLRLPPPARGRSGEFDGGPAPIEGAGEDLSAARYGFSFDLFRLPSSAMAAMIGAVNRKSNCIRKPWRLEAAYSSSTSAASEHRSSSMAQLKPSKKPARDSGDISTSSGRPFSRSATAFNASTGASGLVPAPVLDGGKAGLRLIGGERGGLDCIRKSFRRVLSTITRDLCTIFSFHGVLYVKLYIHRYNE